MGQLALKKVNVKKKKKEKKSRGFFLSKRNQRVIQTKNNL